MQENLLTGGEIHIYKYTSNSSNTSLAMMMIQSHSSPPLLLVALALLILPAFAVAAGRMLDDLPDNYLPDRPSPRPRPRPIPNDP
jgi:hypothetical protein